MLRAAGRSLRAALLPVRQAQQQQAVRAFGAHAHGHDDHHDEHHGYENTPTVFDRLVNINVVDLHGKRHSIKALAGQTLAQALIDAGFPKVRDAPELGLNRSERVHYYIVCLHAMQTYFFPLMGFYTQHVVSGVLHFALMPLCL